MQGISRRLLIGWPCCLLLLLLAGARTIAAERQIHGRVVDQAGRPVAGAGVSYFWRANGTGRDKDGRWLDMQKEENVKLFWGHLGEMEPTGRPKPIKTGDDGRFTLTMDNSWYAVMAMDPARARGPCFHCEGERI